MVATPSASEREVRISGRNSVPRILTVTGTFAAAARPSPAPRLTRTRIVTTSPA
jgi:hypothetical protein